MIREDDIGILKVLQDGRVLRIEERLYNTLLMISRSPEDPSWSEGW